MRGECRHGVHPAECAVCIGLRREESEVSRISKMSGDQISKITAKQFLNFDAYEREEILWYLASFNYVNMETWFEFLQEHQEQLDFDSEIVDDDDFVDVDEDWDDEDVDDELG